MKVDDKNYEIDELEIKWTKEDNKFVVCVGEHKEYYECETMAKNVYEKYIEEYAILFGLNKPFLIGVA